MNTSDSGQDEKQFRPSSPISHRDQSCRPLRTTPKRYLVPLSLILTYLTICFALGVGTAGLEEDEAVSFQGSAGLADHVRAPCNPGYDIKVGRVCLPLMMAPYVGSPKDYFLLPLFWVAGFSVGMARMGASFLAAVGIFGAWFFINRFFGAPAAAITAGFLALNPSYIVLPLFDYGNIAFSFGILGALLVAVTRIADGPSHGRFFVLGLATGLGVWGRLNFSWLALAAGVAILVVFRLELIKFPRFLPALIAGSLVGAAPLVTFLLHHAEDLRSFAKASVVVQSFWQNLNSVLRMVWNVLLASDEHRTTIWHANGIPGELSTTMLVLSAVAVGWCCFRRSKPALAVAVTILVLLLEYIASALPVAGHHTVIFVPLVGLVLGIAVSDLRLVRKGGRVAAGLLCFAYAATAATIDVDSAIRLHRTQGYGYSSAGIYNLVSFLQSHPDQNGLYVLDWGLARPVFVLSKGQLRSESLVRLGFSGGEGPVDWPRLLHNGGTFVTYSLDNLHYPLATIDFERELERSKKPFTKTTFQERDGSPYAYVYVVPPSPAGEEIPEAAPQRRDTMFLASPAEIVSQANGLGKTTLLFWTDRSKLVEIRIGAPDGKLMSQHGSGSRINSGVAKTGNWVSDGMTFYLQDAAGKPLTSEYTLAKVRVSVNKAK